MELVEGKATVTGVGTFVEALGDVGTARDCTLQAFDARYVAGRTHLERALALADRARERGESVARERAVEVLLYAAGRRQIDRALTMGVEEGTTPVVVLVAADPATEDREDRERAVAAALRERAVRELSPEPVEWGDPDRLCTFFEVDEPERRATAATLEELVCERVALLDVEK
jgi:KEOPS complex subunit Cgi121